MTDPSEPGPRQAVVLIHGIGEQRPMETLRSFVDAFLCDGTYHSKPDTESDSYELRRFKLRRVDSKEPAKAVNADWPETDFYEYYWAHQMYGTTVSHVLNWAWIVMRQGLVALGSGDPRYHPRLRWLVPAVWMLAIAVGVGIAIAGVKLAAPAKMATGIGILALLGIWRVCRIQLLRVFTDFVGDAARYFDVSPLNIPRRADIIRGGVTLLRKLHTDHDERGDAAAPSQIMYRYGRIVLVGHSLGSVIAYDILRHYWHEVNGKIPVHPADFEALESFVGGSKCPEYTGAKPHQDAAQFRHDQYVAWQRINSRTPAGVGLKIGERELNARWLVSDLVTLGSPLTYSPLLMARDVEDLVRKIRRRELPVCPPDRSHHLNPGRYTVKLSAEAERFVDFDILPQSAQFATTRWTNFYFHNDPIGGPLGRVFGDGIDDRRLTGPALRPLTAHTGYWAKGRVVGAQPCIEHLAEVLKNG